MKIKNFFMVSLRKFFLLFLSSHLFSFTPPSTIHLEMSSKKVPIKRNQLEIIFKAYTEGEIILGNFVPYAPDAEILQINFPESFWFDIEPYEGSFIVSYQRDGLYQVYGIIEDYELKNMDLPEGIEKEVYLTSNKIYVKVVEGNAIEITERQYNHEQEKIQMEKNQGKALGRVQRELEYIVQNFEEFGIEEGEYPERLAVVENDLGIEIYADNGDIHQRYLAEESQIICPFPICKRIPFCLRYILDKTANIPIILEGTIKYENPTLCHYPDNQCAEEPVKKHIVWIAVRSYVWLKGIWCYGIPEGLNVLTIKTLVYPFQTDEEGKIHGVIYAAPPFDQGMPYIEYVDTRVPNVDAINCNSGLSLCNYLKQDTPFTTKEPNSVFYPKICNEMGVEIPCFDQSFDPNNLLLSLNVLYKERYEKRTFFFKLEKNLSNVSQKWASWGIGDTCLPLRGAYVENWPEICSSPYDCTQSNGLFSPSNYNCDANIFERRGEYYNPSIKILVIDRSNNSQEVKWMMKTHSHEAGHWLYWVMKEKNFEFYQINQDNCLTKCECLTHQQDGALAEAFAESHIFEFVYARITGYGDYEFEQGGEVDTICELPIQIYSNEDPCPRCKEKCVSCNEPQLTVKSCTGPGEMNPYCCFGCKFPQLDAYKVSCTDFNNSPCVNLPVSTQASLLRDIYDSVNSFRLDGGMDNVILPINQMFHCLKGKVNGVTSITPFLQAISDRNICNVDLGSLASYYSISINPPNP